MAGPRLVHRVVPALRLRPRRLRRAVRREARAAARSCARRSASTWCGRAPRRRSTTPASTRGPLQDPLPVWVAVGGDAGVGRPRRHARPADGARDHRRPARALRAVRRAPPPRGRRGRATSRRALSINSHGFIADTSQEAADESFPSFAAMMDRIGRERGWPPMTRARLRRVAARCAARTSSAARRRSSRRSSSSTRSSATTASCSSSASARMPHASTMRSIELLGTEVAPAVRTRARPAGRAWSRLPRRSVRAWEDPRVSTPRRDRNADAIVVGAGLAGLAATAELAAAGQRVILVDQEPEQSLGGQAFWSLGGLFLVDSPEQRRMRIRDSRELALAGLARHGRLRPARGRVAAPLGRGLRRLGGRREARLAARERDPLPPERRLGGARRPARRRARQLGAALPHHAGAPARACWSRSSPRCARPSATGSSSSASATASTA